MFSSIKDSQFLIALGKILKFLIPFGVWIFILGGHLTGENFAVGDGIVIYGMVTYFAESILRGDFPLWNPFIVWGVPDLIGNNFIGVFNPVWWLVVVFHKLGLPYYFSFLYTNTIYFFFGMMGFYFFAKAFLRDKLGAYLCFLMMLFSMQCVYQNFATAAVIYVPITWFFLFLAASIRNTKSKVFYWDYFCADGHRHVLFSALLADGFIFCHIFNHCM